MSEQFPLCASYPCYPPNCDDHLDDLGSHWVYIVAKIIRYNVVHLFIVLVSNRVMFARKLHAGHEHQNHACDYHSASGRVRFHMQLLSVGLNCSLLSLCLILHYSHVCCMANDAFIRTGPHVD